MSVSERAGRVIAVVGATGLQGRAVTRRLLEEGWRVRALTRDPTGKQARALAGGGAEVRKADSSDVVQLEDAVAGASGVYSVQNHHISGYDGEVEQGRNVATAVARAGVGHLVYASAGPGSEATGVRSWDAKRRVIDHAHGLGIPLTVLRPVAFMELMTEQKFYPAASVWHLMPKLMGPARPVGWIGVEDLAVIAARAFAEPDGFVGRELGLASDVQSIDGCREIWREVSGRAPRRFPMPRWLFERFSGTDETTMWRWLAENEVDWDTRPTREVHPGALTVRDWVVAVQQGSGARARGPGTGSAAPP